MHVQQPAYGAAPGAQASLARCAHAAALPAVPAAAARPAYRPPMRPLGAVPGGAAAAAARHKIWLMEHQKQPAEHARMPLERKPKKVRAPKVQLRCFLSCHV